jgi:hypothetical protein
MWDPEGKRRRRRIRVAASSENVELKWDRTERERSELSQRRLVVRARHRRIALTGLEASILWCPRRAQNSARGKIFTTRASLMRLLKGAKRMCALCNSSYFSAGAIYCLYWSCSNYICR